MVLDNRFCWPTIFRDATRFSESCLDHSTIVLEVWGDTLNCYTISSQTNRQAKVFNREVKHLLQKLIHPNRKDWSKLLDDTFWAQRIAYRTPLGMSPFRVVFGKACHLPLEIEHRSYWAVKSCNMTLKQAKKERKLSFQELDKLCLQAYENSRMYKEKVRKFHDTKILRKEFFVRQKVLLFNSRLKLIAVEIKDEAMGRVFKVSSHKLKLFQESKPIEKAQNIDDVSLVEPILMEEVFT
ncbi:uncharacterized protein LOC113859471 [Abrus precatorius]|uniref:Uncharacterized protein LOC113859471 n=1 Tax=Abrus precatorius TaxID=3816 RepID=A0A8B8L081_ABRPR|nr:uncharacterized protein LOC113859471 [Abrus precatorius]